ncbi:Lactosylceramide 1 [Nibea albiflora]|uniref:Lactosylceramide 1 n=1 Tax=Nibea albiflora TaxID=240163 RepID=A0ACB7FIN9_NIBAL|nr:Lactosylceramide 1 [Nibea albiflora]
MDNNVVSHVKSYSYRYLVNRFTYINKSLTIPREQARSFSNFRYLLDHPHKCADKDVLLLLFVKTSPENIERRNAIRSTWGNETYIQNTLGVTVKVVFALGTPQTKEEEPSWSRRSRVGFQEQLTHEDRVHGDLIQQDFLDSFHNLTLKLILQFHWMHHHCAHARFLMTADDDIFVHMPNLMYPWLSYPDYTAGAGYVVSRDVADRIYQATLTLKASLYIDDVFMGICANAIGVSPQEHVYFSGEGKAPYHLCIYDQMMTSHGHVEDIYDLWKDATDPQVKQRTSGLIGRLYCTMVKMSLLCQPYHFNTYPCKAAFI